MHYSRCPECPGTNNCLPPDGPEDAAVLFIGEAPGIQENKKGRVFIGRSGEEVDRHYLPLAGLRRTRVRITNAIRCLPVSAGGKLDGGRAKDIALLQSCAAHHLSAEIERARYQVLVPMGAFACRYVCPEIDLELQHGIPVDTRWGIPAYPMMHPARGLHEPKQMLHIRTDWHRLKSYLNGTLKVAIDEYPEPDYQEVTDAREFLSLDPTRALAGDTESTRKREPYCLTYTQSPGAGRLIRAERRDLLSHFQRYLERWRAPVLFHNWLYDWPVVGQMGLVVPPRTVVDTMACVYHLGNLPQGLKALAYRELGMVMEDFDDVVTPYSLENVLYYYRMAQTYDWPKPDEQMALDEKTGLWKLYKPQSMNTKFKRFFTDYGKNPELDVFERWANWGEAHAMIEAECGEWPGKCITHAPFEKVLHYACRDADATLRLWHLILRMRRNVRKFSQEHWRAA